MGVQLITRHNENKNLHSEILIQLSQTMNDRPSLVPP